MSGISNCKPERNVILSDLICGCIMGGAVGDALGYPVRFTEYDEIKRNYGDGGITKLDVSDGLAQISNNTLTALYTANAIIREKTKRLLDGTSLGLQHYIRRAYENRCSAQNVKDEGILNVPEKLCWIYNADVFRATGFPKSVCVEETINANGRKSCTELAGAAPIGCFYGAKGKPFDAAKEGAETAKITSGHALGYIPAAFLSCLIAKIIDYRLSGESKILVMLIRETLEIIKGMFASGEHYGEFENIVGKAIELGLLRKNKPEDFELIKTFGGGWNAEEVLATAIYSALQYPIDLDKAIICAANNDGDSSLTASITGNIVGAYIGLIKSDAQGDWFTKIDMYDTVFEVSQDLARIAPATDFCDIRDAKWYSKYLYCTYMMRR